MTERKFKPYNEAGTRWMIRRDIEPVLAIETASFEFPWSEEDFLAALQQRAIIGMVSLDTDTMASMGEDPDDIIHGYMIYQLHKDHFRILNLAVDPKKRRLRAAAGMVKELIRKLSTQRRTHIITEVRAANLDAHLFFKSVGFFATRVAYNCYDDCDDDAYVMEYHHKPLKSEFIPVNRIASKGVRDGN